MTFIDRLGRWEGMIFGFILGIAATIVGSMAYNEVHGLLRVNHLKRSLHNKQLDEIATLMEDELAAATNAMKDGVPLELSHYLALPVHAAALRPPHGLRHDPPRNQVNHTFNALRKTTHFLTFNLAHRDLSGLDLRDANFSSSELTGTTSPNATCPTPISGLPKCRGSTSPTLRSAEPRSIVLCFRAQPSPASTARNRTSRTRYWLTHRSSVSTTSSSPTSPAPSSLRPTSSTPDFLGLFDGADFTLASAVRTDFAEVESMNDVNLTGANFTGARIEPGKIERAWFVNTDGIQVGGRCPAPDKEVWPGRKRSCRRSTRGSSRASVHRSRRMNRSRPEDARRFC